MRIMLLSAALVMAALSPIAAHSGSPPAQASATQTEEALFAHELAERDLAYRLAPIKSAVDVRSYVAKNARVKTPLSGLSKGAQQRFLQSLVFTDMGLASFDYRDLRAELTATQIHELLGLFGAQRSTKAIPDLRIANSTDAAIAGYGGEDAFEPVDYPDMWCESRATCRPSTGGICIGSNC